MQKFRCAAVQMCSGTDPRDNIATLETMVAAAAAKGAHYVQTPEMTGALQRSRQQLYAHLQDEANDLVVQAAAALARKYSLYLHIGSTAIATGDNQVTYRGQVTDRGQVANRGFIFSPKGEKIAHYDKIHMFDVDLDNGESWRESAVYKAGDKAVVVSLPFITMGMGICYDVRFPQLFQQQALNGAHMLSAPAAFTRQTGEAHWHVLQRARAIENGAFMVSAAQAGLHQDGRETYGHSIIVDPWGTILAEAQTQAPDLIVCDIDPALSVAARAKIPNLKNIASFTLETV